MSYSTTTYSNNSETGSSSDSSSDLPTPNGYHRMADGSLMIGDYHSVTFNYTLGDTFLSGGYPYIGYYNI